MTATGMTAEGIIELLANLTADVFKEFQENRLPFQQAYKLAGQRSDRSQDEIDTARDSVRKELTRRSNLVRSKLVVRPPAEPTQPRMQY